ncbi:MAG: PQQ-dependent sugar dehydrogenase [bacterium]|nr:PQQ-dependent sugar dehydrogenase [bacterium]
MNWKTYAHLFLILVIFALMAMGVHYLGVLFPPNVPAENIHNKLKLPPGFEISVFAKNLDGVRAMLFDSFGNMWVSRTDEGIVDLLEVGGDGRIVRQTNMFTGLNKPHGLAINPSQPYVLYIAENDKISRVPIYSEGGLEKIVDLPGDGRHFTRTIGFGPDDRLYVSIGSSCDVCDEQDVNRAKIFSLNGDGGDFKEFARGLRNSVFFTWSYVDGRMWATEMGRDWLGDSLPPDEINIIEKGQNYGWPVCYGKNVHDTDFDKNTYIRNPCSEPLEKPSYIDIPAHSAPLGLAFVPEEGWPESYWYNLFVAYHGSWNRSQATGYKIVRAKLDERGQFSGFEDFITGWLQPNGQILGRPVDILIQPGGIMYISDDHAGAIYKVVYTGIGDIKNFGECSLKYPIMESYPSQCRVPDGQTFTEDIGNESEKMDLIRLDSPRPNQIVQSPLKIAGQARGYWYFEASFPIYVVDANGGQLGIGVAQAQPDSVTGEVNWMTEEFVPFMADITFTEPTTATGVLILRKDNPSGLPEYDDELAVPVLFGN